MLLQLMEEYHKQYSEMDAPGVADGKAKGFVLGESQGLRHALGALLTQRFGDIPPAWQTSVVGLADTAKLSRMIRAVYQVPTPEDFETMLTKASS